jgi:hypothetical protein
MCHIDIYLYIRPNAIRQKQITKTKMENTFEKHNEEALLNAFKIEELEERLETATWHANDKGVPQLNIPL